MPNLPKSFTFAFSKKLDSWTTRYSFTPTCYANCGDVMLSSADTKGVWRHDESPQRNSFYGRIEPSMLTVVSNADPSAIKMFKSISLETNKSDWEATFSSNDEYSDSNKQRSNKIVGFKDKEAFKYREIPRSVVNSTAHLSPCPLLSPYEGIVAEYNYNSYEVVIQPDYGMATPQGNLLGLIGTALKTFSQYTSGQWQDIFMTTNSFLFEDGSQGVGLDISLNLPIVQSSSDPAAAQQELFNKINLFIGYVRYIATNATVNGDQMRGPYLKANLSIKTEDPLELNAVNIDYEFSKLDKRLNQNT